MQTNQHGVKIMKKLLIIPMFLLSVGFVKPQNSLTLDECYIKSRENYPLIKQKEYIEKKEDRSADGWQISRAGSVSQERRSGF